MISITTSITASLAQGPPQGIILAALVGLWELFKLCLLLLVFWKGIQNAPEGWTIVDELRPEVHTDKKIYKIFKIF